MHALPREGGAVPEGLPSGYGQTSVMERFHTGSLEQLRPFHGSGFPPRRRQTGAYQIPEATPEVPYMSPRQQTQEYWWFAALRHVINTPPPI